MQRLPYLFHVLLSVCLAVCACSGDRTEYRNDRPSLCGPVSLQIALKSQGVVASLDELCALSGYDSVTGTTMLGLHDAARRKGVAVAPVRLDLGALCGVREKSVLFVDENHFLVFCKCNRDNVILEDPFMGRYSQSKAEFARRWNGETLLFGRMATVVLENHRVAGGTVQPGPKIEFTATRHSFGLVDESSVLTCTFLFRNTGSDTLLVNVRSGCGCATASLSGDRVPPGADGSVRVVFDTENRKGFISQKIAVRTNDPGQPMFSLAVSAHVRGMVKLLPDRLWIDTIGCGDSVVREVLVLDSGEGSLAVERVEVPEGVSAEICPARSGKDGARVIPVLLRVTGNRTGTFNHTAVIHTNDRQRKALSLPITGEVVPELTVLPPRVFFGTIRPDTAAVREIAISSRNERDTGEIRVKIANPRISLDLTPTTKGNKYRLIATVAGLTPGGTVRDSIAVYIGDSTRPEMHIPLYARASE